MRIDVRNQRMKVYRKSSQQQKVNQMQCDKNWFCISLAQILMLFFLIKNKPTWSFVEICDEFIVENEPVSVPWK